MLLQFTLVFLDFLAMCSVLPPGERGVRTLLLFLVAAGEDIFPCLCFFKHNAGRGRVVAVAKEGEPFAQRWAEFLVPSRTLFPRYRTWTRARGRPRRHGASATVHVGVYGGGAV